MGQLTIYLPDEVEKEVRRDAVRARKTVSAYIATLARQKSQALDKNGYPLDFAELFGCMPDFTVPPRDRTPPEIPDLDPVLPRGQRRKHRVHKRRRPSRS